MAAPFLPEKWTGQLFCTLFPENDRFKCISSTLEVPNMKTIQLTLSCKDYLWGGEKLRTEYGIQSDLHPRVNNAFLIFRRAERDQNAHDTGVAHKGISPVKDRLFLLNTRMTFLPPLCNISCRQFLPRRDPEGQRYSLGRLCHRGCFHRGRPSGALSITFRLVHIPHQTTHRFSISVEQVIIPS